MVRFIITGGLKYLILLMFVNLILSGCGKEQEKPESGDNTVEKESVIPETVEEEKPVIADITGTYSGTFDQRPTTLKIKEQNGKDFKGNITINYREVINQEITGTYDPETGTIKMKDMLHSRFRGKYSGKLSEDMKTYSGTFTMDLDGTKFNFNLKKNK